MTLETLFETAMTIEYPAEAMQYEEPKKRSLVLLCQELQRHRGDLPFHLGAPTTARLLDISEPKAAAWLSLLVADRVLRIHQRGGGPGHSRFIATEYFYCSSEDTGAPA